MSFLNFLAVFVDQILNLLSFAVIARVIVSWLSPQGIPGRLGEILHEITEPVLRVARLIPHRVGFIDLSPLIGLIGLEFLRFLFLNLFSYVASL